MLLESEVCCQDWIGLQEMQHQLDRHQSRVKHVEAALHKVSVISCCASFASLPHDLRQPNSQCSITRILASRYLVGWQ